MTEQQQAEIPEARFDSEIVDVRRRMDETWAGDRAVDPSTYPYFNPDYRLPFKHIGLQKQLFLDNYILDELIDAERTIPPPQKAEPPLIEFENLPWERYHFTCVPAAALYDPDDRLFKMWYKTLVSGNTNSAQGTEVVLCYAESDDALHWRKPLRDDCQPFQDSPKTNIVVRDFDNGTIVLNPDRSNPQRKFLAVYNPSMEATRRGRRVMSRVAASPDGIHWHVISDDSPFRHHHQMRVIWDDAYKKWVGYSQASHAFASHLHVRTIGRQESADFINWSPKQIILSSDWDPNVGPNVEFHTMSVRKEGGLYIGIVEEAHGEHQWLVNRDGSNQRDQFHTKAALYTSRDGRRFFRADGYQPWADNGPPGSQYYGYFCHTVAGYLLHQGKMVIPCSAFPHKQRDTRPAGVSNHVPLIFRRSLPPPHRGPHPPRHRQPHDGSCAPRPAPAAEHRRHRPARGRLGRTPTQIRDRPGHHQAVRVRRQRPPCQRRLRLRADPRRPPRLRAETLSRLQPGGRRPAPRALPSDMAPGCLERLA